MTVEPEDDWLSWSQAAELVGCAVATIEHYRVTGRIESRPHQGLRPTLRRTSVEEFGRWYSARAARLESAAAGQRAGSDDPPDPVGWLSTKEACAVLGRTPANIGRLVRTGDLPGVRKGRRLWVREADVHALAAARSEWVSIRTAAVILGVPAHVAQRWADTGRLGERRPGVGQAVPTIQRAEVERVRDQRL